MSAFSGALAGRARSPLIAAIGSSFWVAWAPVLVVWVVSRLFYLGCGIVGHAAVPRVSSIGVNDRSEALGYWANWDGEWFSGVALNGYDTEAATAFFPLYPLLVRAGVEVGLGVAIAAILVSTLATLTGLYFVYALALRWYGQQAALAAILTLAFFPTAFFLNAAYSDALFLALTAGSMWALYVRREIVIAGVFAYFAALTRNIGGLLLLPLGYEWLRNRREFGGRGLAGVVLPVAGFGSYALYLWLRMGDPLLFSKAYAENWDRTLVSPLQTIRDGFDHAGDGIVYLLPGTVLDTAAEQPPILLSNTLNFWALMFVFAALVLAVRRVRVGLLLYAAPAVLGALALNSPTLPPLVSYSRYVVVVFPLFLAIGVVLAKRRVALTAWLAVSALIGGYLTILFTSGRWVA